MVGGSTYVVGLQPASIELLCNPPQVARSTLPTKNTMTGMLREKGIGEPSGDLVFQPPRRIASAHAHPSAPVSSKEFAIAIARTVADKAGKNLFITAQLSRMDLAMS